ncbi:AP2-like DNA-binding integrase domain-containing protein [Nonomuraea maritima]|uniref:AP2-like DNA-binding integrase domain-containing protein n=1 Tax=Nonomuraea maritima TaxID=683260 RepID=A0A1G9SWB7_9ACTN|nr:Arm DNA-binding domain-containing protein [Nonomuraea maritima]SDM39702.1 AP2-like DNA-binding integrase domain-containing protein [Nonomuraea maritima]
MTKRRSRGDGGLHWDDKRQRWIATVTVGYSPAGKRIVKKGSGKTKTEAKEKLKEVLRDYDDGLTLARGDATVEQAVNDWLKYELSRRDKATFDAGQIMCRIHVIPALGRRKLRELSAQDVDTWLADKAKTLSTSTLRLIRSYLNRSLKRAMARDLVKRNVVDLCSVPRGKEGRPELRRVSWRLWCAPR